MNWLRRIIWWWQDRPYMNIDLSDCDLICNCDGPSISIDPPATSGATTSVNI